MTLYCLDCPFKTSDSNRLGEHITEHHPYWKRDRIVVFGSLALFVVFFFLAVWVKLQ